MQHPIRQAKLVRRLTKTGNDGLTNILQAAAMQIIPRWLTHRFASLKPAVLQADHCPADRLLDAAGLLLAAAGRDGCVCFARKKGPETPGKARVMGHQTVRLWEMPHLTFA